MAIRLFRLPENMSIYYYQSSYNLLECSRDNYCINNNLDEDISYVSLMHREKINCTCDMRFCTSCDEEYSNDDSMIHCKLCNMCHNIHDNYVCYTCKACHNIYDCDEVLFCVGCTYNNGVDCRFKKYGHKCVQLSNENKEKIYFHKQCLHRIDLSDDFIDKYLEIELMDDPFGKEWMVSTYNEFSDVFK